MVRPISMPKLGQSEEEAKIVRWLKKEGETVQKGEILFEVETDKALLEVESFFTGSLLKVLVGEGQTVPVQSTVGYIGDPGDVIPALPDRPLPSPKPVAQGPGRAASGVSQPVPVPATSRPRAERRESPQTRTRPAPELPPQLAATQEAAIFRITPRAAKLAE